MKLTTRQRLTSAALGLIVTAGTVAAATGPAPREKPQSAEAKAKLAAVRGNIAALTSRLGAALAQRDAIGARLREADLAITAQRLRLENLRAAQAAAERHRAQVRTEAAHARALLSAERRALEEQTRAAYMLGPAERLELLLSQRDPAIGERMVTFYGYLARARAQRIAQVETDVRRVQDLAVEVEQTTAKLKAMQADAAQQLNALSAARRERVAALAAVAVEVESGTREMGRLRQQERAEEELIADLARMLEDVPTDAAQDFAAMRGRLPWPVTGRLATRYQEALSSGTPSVRSNGILIDGLPSAKVQATGFGRVVYADWLQGLGLLLIINHSGGYMTLYGHAEVLYKNVGDWVAPGDIIAALGDSGPTPPQLYFEIREGRRTVDPEVWLERLP